MRTLTLLLMLAAMIPAHAQKGLQLGVKTIPGWAWFLNEDDAADASFGWAYGAGFNYHFKDGFGVGADLIWTDEEQNISINGNAVRSTFSFLKVPLLIHFNSDPGETIPFLGYFGVQFSTLRKVDTEVNGHAQDSAEDLFQSSNLGAVVGLGPGWNINEHVQFTSILRFDYQFKNIEAEDVNFFGNGRGPTHEVTFGIDLGLKLIIGTGGS